MKLNQLINTVGNLNRIQELSTAGYTAGEIASIFQTNGIHIVATAGDLPLIRNLDALGSRAMRKRVANSAISLRASAKDWLSAEPPGIV